MSNPCMHCAVLALSLLLCVSICHSQSYLTILHLNDTHSNLAPGAPRDAQGAATEGGVARAATVIATERMADPNALVLHAGDVFIGDPAFNLSMTTMEQPELLMLASLGIDAMAVGNHEFDLGAEALLGCLATSFAQSGFPLLSSNLDYSAAPGHGLANFILPNTIVQKGDVKVGVFGMTTPEVELTQQAAPLVVSDDLMTIASQQVAALQAQGCDVIIFLSHLGYALDVALATNVPGIHLVIGGHDHFAHSEATHVSSGTGTTYIVQAGAFYRWLGKTRLKIDGGIVTMEEYTLLHLDEGVDELESMKTACDGLYQQLDAAVGGLLFTTVGHATGVLSEVIHDTKSAGNFDTHVGNLCADAYVAATGADFCIQPGGSTSQQIYPGPIKSLDLFRCIGYGMNAENGIGFGLVTVDMTGEALRAAIEVSLMFVEDNDEMLFHPSEALEYSFSLQAPAGARLLTLNFNNAPIDPSATYTVAINELLLAYTDYFASMDPRISYTNLQTFESNVLTGPLTEFEALLGYVAAMHTVEDAPLPGRVTSVLLPVEPLAAVAATPALHQNFPNPFSGTTSISFSLPARMHASIAVFDAMGRRVALLGEGEYDTGQHRLSFDAGGLPAGLYFCRLLAADRVRITRMALLR